MGVLTTQFIHCGMFVVQMFMCWSIIVSWGGEIANCGRGLGEEEWHSFFGGMLDSLRGSNKN